MKKEYDKGQKLIMADLGLCLMELSGQLLQLLAREGAESREQQTIRLEFPEKVVAT